MSGSDLRPKSYGWVDKNNVNSYAAALEIPEAASGYDDGAIPPAEKYNMVMQRHAGWAAHLDGRAMRSEHIMGSVTCRISPNSFSFAPGAGFSHPVAADSAYVVNGYIVDLPIARLADDGYSPFVFTASKWTHWYVDKDGVSFSIVNIGVAAAPAAGQVHLGTAVTDAVALTAWAAGSSSFTDRRVLITPILRLLGALDVASTAAFAGAVTFNNTTTFNDASTWSVSNGSSALTITQAGTGRGIQLLGPSSDLLLDVIKSGSGTAAKFVHSGTGRAVHALGSSGASTMLLENDADQFALEVISGPSASYAASFVGNPSGDAAGAFMQGHGEGYGGFAESGTTDGASGFQGRARNDTGHGIEGISHSSATIAARGGFFAGQGNAAGLEATSAAYYAAILTPDVTAPTYAALFAAPQNSAPTNTSSGSLTYVGGSIDSWGQANFADSNWRYFWSTPGGWCYGFATGGPTLNSNSGSYTALATVTIAAGGDAPKVSGRTVRLTVSMRVGHSAAATNYCDVQIRDTTGAPVTIVTRAGAGITSGAGYYLPAVAGDFTTAINFEILYTVPAAGARTLVLEFKRNNANSNVTAMGSLKVEGLY